MTGILGFIIRIYGLLLRLFPSSFQSEFEEQMLLDFADMATDAKGKGKLYFLLFCLRELVDLPLNLLQAHWREGNVLRVFHLKPVDYGLRSALGFGIVFAMAIPIGVFASEFLHTEQEFRLLSWIPTALGSLFSGLMIGTLLAVLFADRSKYSQYIFVGMLGWFLHDMAMGLALWCFNLDVFLDGSQYIYFNFLSQVLSGAFLGLIFVLARSTKRESLRLLVAATFGYPIMGYLYVKQLFNLFIFNTPWRFVALISLIVVFIGFVFFVAIKGDSGRKLFWVVVIAAIGNPFIRLLIFLVGKLFYPPIPSWAVPYDGSSIVASNGIYGILFGLLLGIGLGFQKNPPPVTA